MDARTEFHPTRKSLARRAGLLYLLACFFTPIALLNIPRRILVAGDVAATAELVRTSAGLLRTGMLIEIWSCVVMVFVGFALYRLFEDVDRRLALMTAVLMWIATPMQLLNLVFTSGALMLTTSPAYAHGFTPAQIDTLIYLFFRLHSRGIELTQILWGLWLFPWGLVAIRSRFIPSWIGIAELVAGSGYVLASLVAIAVPALTAVVPIGLALGVGELPMGIWLLVWGAREERK